MKKELSHVNPRGLSAMVDVGQKEVTRRLASASCVVRITREIADLLKDGDIQTKKGPVFQTAILAGTMAVKKTGELIPLCHPLLINRCDIDISMNDDFHINIECVVGVDGKTGVEMEALTGAGIAALTVYDMCKAISHDIVITDLKLNHKSGGKHEFNRT